MHRKPSIARDVRCVWNYAEVVALMDLRHLLFTYRFPRAECGSAADGLPVLTKGNITAMSRQPLDKVKAEVDKRYQELRLELYEQLQSASWPPTPTSLVASAAASLLHAASSPRADDTSGLEYLPGVRKSLQQHMQFAESNDARKLPQHHCSSIHLQALLLQRGRLARHLLQGALLTSHQLSSATPTGRFWMRTR